MLQTLFIISASFAWTENQGAKWGFFEGLLQGCHGLSKTATLQSLKLFWWHFIKCWTVQWEKVQHVVLYHRVLCCLVIKSKNNFGIWWENTSEWPDKWPQEAIFWVRAFKYPSQPRSNLEIDIIILTFSIRSDWYLRSVPPIHGFQHRGRGKSNLVVKNPDK